MNHDIAFLHTSEVHIQTFQSLVDEIDSSIRVRHDVNEALLADAIETGITQGIRERVQAAMQTASNSQAQVIVCTCSTIGAAAEVSLQADRSCSMRIDRAMADHAVANFEKVLVVAAVESTLAPTKVLLEESATNAGKHPDVSLQLVEGAWSKFEAGDMDAYYNCIAGHINQQHHRFDCTVLAQASMAPVTEQLEHTGIHVIASPRYGVRSAIKQLRSQC